jgi:hypothetical protein
MEAFLIIIKEGVPFNCIDHQRTVDSFLQLCYDLRRLPSEEGVCPVEKTASTRPEDMNFRRLSTTTTSMTLTQARSLASATLVLRSGKCCFTDESYRRR